MTKAVATRCVRASRTPKKAILDESTFGDRRVLKQFLEIA